MSDPRTTLAGAQATRPPGLPGRIVVGIDGSEEASRALQWAIEEARLRSAVLEIVSTWYLPGYGWGDVTPAPGDPGLQFAANARGMVEEAASQARLALPGIEVVATALEGSPAAVLVELSKDAGLLVVGSRGRGGFKGLLMGSVSQECTAHAHCPIVIVH
ncbi:MAG: universal stress protein [Actinobacteria bacterium]|nr:universal stress protein [Actinomycetota bacterium]